MATGRPLERMVDYFTFHLHHLSLNWVSALLFSSPSLSLSVKCSASIWRVYPHSWSHSIEWEDSFHFHLLTHLPPPLPYTSSCEHHRSKVAQSEWTPSEKISFHQYSNDTFDVPISSHFPPSKQEIISRNNCCLSSSLNCNVYICAIEISSRDVLSWSLETIRFIRWCIESYSTV